MGLDEYMRYLVERMRLDDIPQVRAIEVQSFSSPWSAQAYEHDLRTNRLAHYVVLRELDAQADAQPSSLSSPTSATGATPFAQAWRKVWQRIRGHRDEQTEPPRAPIIGFAGVWMMVDEAHLVTIAVEPGHRGKGLGELLLISMIDLACILGASRMTLEVRASNHVAQSLYRKYGFTNEGVRRRYYTDNGEDALIMTSDTLTSAPFQSHYQSLKRARLGQLKVTFNLV